MSIPEEPVAVRTVQERGSLTGHFWTNSTSTSQSYFMIHLPNLFFFFFFSINLPWKAQKKETVQRQGLHEKENYVN